MLHGSHSGSTSQSQQPAFCRDRTNELRGIFDALKRSGATSGVAGDKAAATASAAALTATANPDVVKFNVKSRQFAAEISGISASVATLAKLLQAQPAGAAFEEGSDDVARLTRAVQTRLGKLHDDMDALTDLQRTLKGKSSVLDRHHDGIVTALRSNLVGAGSSFKTVLQRRTQGVKGASSRRSLLVSDRPNAGAHGASSLSKFGGAGGGSSQFGGAAGGGFNGGGEMQLQQQQAQLGAQNLSYHQDRAAAVQQVEVAVRQVAELMADFSRLVYEQEETIVRIDADVQEAHQNVISGTEQLMIYLRSLTAQRGLILKVLGMLFVFLLFFGFVVVR